MEKSKYIDHTLLKAVAKKEDIKKLCDEALKYDFASVMVNPYYVSYAKELLKGSNVLTACVIGFPLGGNTKEVKAFEAKNAVSNGADEVDMVINIGAAKDHDYKTVYEDIKAVKDAVGDTTLKVIIETCYLTDEEKTAVCKEAVKANAQFVKTSTGFGTAGAKASDVKLMKEAVKGSNTQVKASGGVHNRQEFEEMINAGATRIGCSAGVQIMEGYQNE